MKNVVVMFGGQSVEHDISIITGLGVVNNLSEEYNSIVVYVDRRGEWWTGEKLKNIETFKEWNTKGLKCCAFLPNSRGLTVFSRFSKKTQPIYSVINCMHGFNGEDGGVQGVLKLAKVPSTSSSILATSLCMNKSLTKQVLEQNKIKVTKGICFSVEEFQNNYSGLIKRIKTKIKFPCIVKPNNLGSSVGVCVSNSEEELKNSIEVAFNFDNEVLVETYLNHARELNIAVFDDEEIKVSNVEEVCNNGEVYNFDDKYKNKQIKRIVPAKLDNEMKTEIERSAISAYKILGCTGIVRVDFLLFEDKLYLNEVNSIPGSFACNLFKEPKISYKKLLTTLIETNVKQFKKSENIKREFNSTVLKNLNNNSFKMSK